MARGFNMCPPTPLHRNTISSTSMYQAASHTLLINEKLSDQQRDSWVCGAAWGKPHLFFDPLNILLLFPQRLFAERKKKISSLLFPSPFLMSHSRSLCRDGPDQASPQIGQFSGSSTQEGVSTTANQILIKFHSDFSTSGFFVLRYHGNLPLANNYAKTLSKVPLCCNIPY